MLNYKLEILLTIILLILLWVYSEHKKVYWFYMDSCGYCINMKREWELFEKLCQNTLLVPIRIDYKDPTNIHLVNKYQIKSVPTIILLTKNSTTTYRGPRKANAIYKWAIETS